MSIYTDIDVAIIDAIRRGASPLYDRRVMANANALTVGTKREPFRVIDTRLQALRREGHIEHITKARAVLCGKAAGWNIREAK